MSHVVVLSEVPAQVAAYTLPVGAAEVIAAMAEFPFDAAQTLGDAMQAAEDAIADVEDAKNAAILAVQAVAELRPAVFISVTGSMNLVAGWAYGLDATTGTTVELTLPANPSPGDTILIVDRETIGFATTYVLKRNGKTIKSLAEDMTIDVPGIAFHITWNGSDWRTF